MCVCVYLCMTVCIAYVDAEGSKIWLLFSHQHTSTPYMIDKLPTLSLVLNPLPTPICNGAMCTCNRCAGNFGYKPWLLQLQIRTLLYRWGSHRDSTLNNNLVLSLRHFIAVTVNVHIKCVNTATYSTKYVSIQKAILKYSALIYVMCSGQHGKWTGEPVLLQWTFQKVTWWISDKELYCQQD